MLLTSARLMNLTFWKKPYGRQVRVANRGDLDDLVFLGHGGRHGQRDAATDAAEEEVDLLSQDEVFPFADPDIDLELGVTNRQHDLPPQDAAGGIDLVDSH